MIIKECGSFDAMMPLPNGGWLTNEWIDSKYRIIKISSCGEIIGRGLGVLNISQSVFYREQSFGISAEYQGCLYGINSDGELSLSGTSRLIYKKTANYFTKIVTRYSDKALSFLLGIKEKEVGLVICNYETEEAKLLVVHDGVFDKNHYAFEACISHDDMTVIMYQKSIPGSNFVIIDIDI